MKKGPNAQSLIPNSEKKIFLVGMPAAGKTYWGTKIAREYKLPFADLDNFITEQEQASISALFAMYGENGFREREQKYLKKIIATAKRSTIIACGGGTPCFGDNMELMKEAGVVIYLQADLTSLLDNIKNSNEVRPLLNNRGNLDAYLHDMLQKRKKFYESAHHILHTKDISVATFAQIISHV